MLTINLEWDSDALAAPQSFRDGIQAAADVLEAAIYDPITVNVSVGYGEYDLGGPEYMPLTGDSFGGVLASIPVSYPALRAALAAKASSATDTDAVNALPNATSLDGQTGLYLATAEAKALGALPANDPAIDGYVGFPTSFTGNVLISTGITELVHAMGLLNGGFPLSLVQYTSPGAHYFTDGDGSISTPAYFSIDGGDTNLANYSVGFDPTLFSNVSGDPLAYPAGGTSLSALDLTEIGAIGFDTNATPTLPSPSITPTTTAADMPISVNVQNVSVGENDSLPALSMIASVTAPGGDDIASYSFEDSGGDGHFVLNGLVEPDNQEFTVLDTQLGLLQYVGGSSPGSDQIDVGASDAADDFSQFGYLTATTTSNAPIIPSGPDVVTLAANADDTVSSPDQTIVLGGGNSDVTLASTASNVYGDGGSDFIADGGGADTIHLGTGSTTLTATTGGPFVYGSDESGPLFFSGGSGAATLYAGAGATTVFANAGGGAFFGGSASSLLFVGGSGASTVVGCNGSNTLFGGSSGDDELIAGNGPSTVIGSGSGITLVGLGSAPDELVAGSGTETLVGSAGGGNDIMFGGTGADALFGGTGSDTFVAASGGAQMVAGAGHAGQDEFLFANGGAGSSDVIWNFVQGQDHVALFGYGANVVANAVAGAVVTAGTTSITLPDNTRITFANVANLHASDFL